jgi:hypothetical protein
MFVGIIVYDICTVQKINTTITQYNRYTDTVLYG